LPVDKQVIEYVNTLPGKYFSTSPEVAPWVYAIYLNKEYRKGVLPYISRSEIMTYKANPAVSYYWWYGDPPTTSLDKAVKFESGGIIVKVVP